MLYVYIFDIEKRRMDVFATHSDAYGEMLGALPEIKSKTCSLQWVECTAKDGAILATYRVLEYEGEELRNVAEAKAA